MVGGADGVEAAAVRVLIDCTLARQWSPRSLMALLEVDWRVVSLSMHEAIV